MHRIRNIFVAAAGVALMAAGAAQAADSRYQVKDLVSDVPGLAAHTDGHLVNPWGIAFNPNGFVWVANNGTGTSSLYDGNGNVNPTLPFITIPGVGGNPGTPTGIVFNGSNDFAVTPGNPGRFIFATQDGTIAAWSPAVDPTHAIQVVAPTGASYTGLALTANGNANFLYAADFLSGRIDVFDKAFQPVTMPGGFVDPHLPAGYAPFNIQNIQGDLYVAYAKREEGEAEEIAGAGLGIVDVFDANGNLVRRVASHGKLNAPWGLVLAPATFGRFADRLLVGNFGDGTINAYDAHSGEFKGQLRGTDNKPLRIEGLWGLAFGNGILSQPTSTLFFAAGINDEEHGLYGSITPVAGGPGNNDDGD